MQRRTFFGLVSSAVLGAAVQAHIPTRWFPESMRREGALTFLTREWNRYVRGSGSAYNPKYIGVGPELFHSYVMELSTAQRFVTVSGERYPHSVFKSAIVIPFENLGWEVQFLDTRPDFRSNPDLEIRYGSW